MDDSNTRTSSRLARKAKQDYAKLNEFGIPLAKRRRTVNKGKRPGRPTVKRRGRRPVEESLSALEAGVSGDYNGSSPEHASEHSSHDQSEDPVMTQEEVFGRVAVHVSPDLLSSLGKNYKSRLRRLVSCMALALEHTDGLIVMHGSWENLLKARIRLERGHSGQRKKVECAVIADTTQGIDRVQCDDISIKPEDVVMSMATVNPDGVAENTVAVTPADATEHRNTYSNVTECVEPGDVTECAVPGDVTEHRDTYSNVTECTEPGEVTECAVPGDVTECAQTVKLTEVADSTEPGDVIGIIKIERFGDVIECTETVKPVDVAEEIKIERPDDPEQLQQTEVDIKQDPGSLQVYGQVVAQLSSSLVSALGDNHMVELRKIATELGVQLHEQDMVKVVLGPWDRLTALRNTLKEFLKENTPENDYRSEELLDTQNDLDLRKDKKRSSRRRTDSTDVPEVGGDSHSDVDSVDDPSGNRVALPTTPVAAVPSDNYESELGHFTPIAYPGCDSDDQPSSPEDAEAPLDPGITYTIIKPSTSSPRQKDKLLDSLGYLYTQKVDKRRSSCLWRCSVRNKKVNCRATVLERKGSYIRGKQQHVCDGPRKKFLILDADEQSSETEVNGDDHQTTDHTKDISYGVEQIVITLNDPRVSVADDEPDDADPLTSPEADDGITYSIIKPHPSSSYKDKLLDSLGYVYTSKADKRRLSCLWRCSVRNSKINCRASVSERKGSYIRGKHQHVCGGPRKKIKIPDPDSMAEPQGVTNDNVTGEVDNHLPSDQHTDLTENLKSTDRPTSESITQDADVDLDKTASLVQAITGPAITYLIVKAATTRGRDKLLDSLGYLYTQKADKRRLSCLWRCSVRNKNINCRATVSDRKGSYIRGKHQHICDGPRKKFQIMDLDSMVETVEVATDELPCEVDNHIPSDPCTDLPVNAQSDSDDSLDDDTPTRESITQDASEIKDYAVPVSFDGSDIVDLYKAASLVQGIKDEEVTYLIDKAASAQGKDMLRDSLGYQYTQKIDKHRTSAYWRCYERNHNIKCKATVTEKNGSFVSGKHQHVCGATQANDNYLRTNVGDAITKHFFDPTTTIDEDSISDSISSEELEKWSTLCDSS